MLPVVFVGVFFAWPLVTVLHAGSRPRASTCCARRAPGASCASPPCRRCSARRSPSRSASPPRTPCTGWTSADAAWSCRLLTVPFVLPTIVVGAAFRALLPTSAQGTHHGDRRRARVLQPRGRRASRRRLLDAPRRPLGAGRAHARRRAGPVWRTVTWPLLRPAVLAASALVFLFTFTSFGVVLVLGGPTTTTLEVEIYRRTVQLFDLPGAATLCVLQILAVLLVLVVAGRLQRRLTVTQRLTRTGAATAPAAVRCRPDRPRRDARRGGARRPPARRPRRAVAARRRPLGARLVACARHRRADHPRRRGVGLRPRLPVVRRGRGGHRRRRRRRGLVRDRLHAPGERPARHRSHAAARHERGDGRLRPAHHLRRRAAGPARAAGSSCRSARRSWRSRSSCARCCRCCGRSTLGCARWPRPSARRPRAPGARSTCRASRAPSGSEPASPRRCRSGSSARRRSSRAATRPRFRCRSVGCLGRPGEVNAGQAAALSVVLVVVTASRGARDREAAPPVGGVAVTTDARRPHRLRRPRGTRRPPGARRRRPARRTRRRPSRCSGRAASASPRCCGSSPASSHPTPGPSSWDGADLARRPRAPAQHRPGVPGRRPLPAPRRRGQRRLRPRGRRRAHGAAARRGRAAPRARRPRGLRGPHASTRSRAVRRSASRSRGRSPRGRICCCSTSRSERSTATCATGSAPRSATCCATKASRPCTSRTTSRRRRSSPTVSSP